MSRASRIIPVLDIIEGVVVHAVAGQREKYKPISSKIVEGSNPVQVADVFRSQFETNEIYIADLDAIRKIGTNLDVINEIVDSTGLNVILDYGVKSHDDAKKLLETGIGSVVVSTESMQSLDVIESALKVSNSIVGSLDLSEGRILAEDSHLRESAPLDLAIQFSQMGLKRLIVLELALVGTGKGPLHSTLTNICTGTSLDIVAGGGVRNFEDLVLLGNLGVSATLVATALHRGSISPEEIRRNTV
ncbi:MAG: HisA/HisF-related TIM barrel protein [Candidatus Thorarchaeota archaeon]|jgi:phosphoribosylformimino-5-aminoimidazole carboxamide ribotide isomerase